MKLSVLSAILLLALITGSCTSTANEKNGEGSSEKESGNIIGRWKLEKASKSSSASGLAYDNDHVQVILNVQKNGYFLVYDSIIDPAWRKKGVPLITTRSRGQWKMEGSSLVLNYSGDSTYTETLEITEVNNSTLITKGQNQQSNVFKTYGRN